MSRGVPRNYVGERFGLVVVTARKDKKNAWVRCDCGCTRLANLSNLAFHPPKTHVRCRELQYDLGLDMSPERTYKESSTTQTLESET